MLWFGFHIQQYTSVLQHNSLSPQQRGALSVSVGAAFWGLFWIPLRYLDEHGVHGLWAVGAVTTAAAIPALSWMLYRDESADLRSRDAWIIGGALGSSATLYFLGIMLSDVIRVILLFYLLPVWTTIAARIMYREPVRRVQVLVIVIALFGMWLLLGAGARLPLPTNVGDWCGLGAGMLWGISLALLRGKVNASALPRVFMTMSATAALSFLIAFCLIYFDALIPGSASTVASAIAGDGWPSFPALLQGVPVILLFGAAVLFPAMFSQIYGAQLIPAPTAALLTMTEIVVASLSAWLLIGTELTRISLLGGAVILIAVIADLGAQYRHTAHKLPDLPG